MDLERQVCDRQGCNVQVRADQIYCSAHDRSENPGVRLYRVAQYQARIAEFEYHEKANSLAEELGITRLVLEQLIVQCEGDDRELVRKRGPINAQITAAKGLVESIHNLQHKMGSLLSEERVRMLGEALLKHVIDAIEKYVPDSDAQSKMQREVATRFIEEVKNA